MKPFYRPPSLIFRQLGSALYLKYLTGWNRFSRWLFHHAVPSIPVANGAMGMGCIGYPGHPVWEVTGACNLECIHCHTTGGVASENELTTDEGKRLIDQLAEMDVFRTLVYSGGEPLVRPDIFELLEHSKKAGFANILATNGTLIDSEMASKLKEHGVVCNAISLDAPKSKTHNYVRNSPSAFLRALRAIEETKKAGILLQVNTTAMGYNFSELSDLIDFVEARDAGIMLMYQLLAVGRGEKIEGAALSENEVEALIDLVARKQKTSSMILEPVAAPQYWAKLLESKGIRSGWKYALAQKVFHGCAAGRGFAYIKANGDVWPCPFFEVSAGNVRRVPFRTIYEASDLFLSLRKRESLLKGACGTCEHRSICGGCRGRAFARTGDYFSEDPRCFLRDRLGTEDDIKTDP
jgi:AdoMet-dependent heme synthase